MSASISLTNLAWSTPDGRTLFSGLTLHFGRGRTGLVGRNGIGKTTLLKLIAGGLVPQTGEVSIHGRLAMLDQTVQAAADAAVADLFGVADGLALLRRAEAGLLVADDQVGIDWTLETRIARALRRFGLQLALDAPLTNLSGGQLTRAKLAALAFAKPDFALLDEPTNNLDRDGRAAVMAMLAEWQGGAIIVSHDRDLLETMDTIVELTSRGATSYGGNWSSYRARKAIELASARQQLADAERRVGALAHAAQRGQERKARKDRVGRNKGRRGDIPAIALGLRKAGSENTAGEAARLAERRRQQASEAVDAARQRIEILQPLAVALPSTGLSATKTVLEIDALSGGYQIGCPIVENFTLKLVGPERVAIGGPNGSGKTTLLSLITGGLPPWSGRVRIMTGFAMLDQQVSLLDRSVSIRDNFRRINPGCDENACRAALARFMFRADAALQIVSGLSGGQALRAGLACVLGGPAPPALLILDEPTNHLDIDAIEAVEAGLRGYDGALLVVSHDPAFLATIGITRWVQLQVPPRA
ncbi:ABC-F family ATP-binding cassette domain-containing protein [Rhodopseudomonas palustris]|uniref:ABC transporter related n=1 Tax=Rhodopseudomonas palustris (strain BisB18) TaxID=316056 RepID=Q21C50_RHOPB